MQENKLINETEIE